MKRLNFVLMMVAVILFSVSSAVAGVDCVDKVEISQATGVFANYDAGAKTTTWSGGASGWVWTQGGSFISFGTTDVTAVFEGAVDGSSGGLANAIFSAGGSWTMDFDGILDSAIHLAGHTLNTYRETETGVDTDHIDGRAVVVIDEATFNMGKLAAFLPSSVDSVEWAGGVGSLSGLIADIALPNGTGITDYNSDYMSTNVTVTLWADEGVVPEPATLCLLGFGAVGLLRRRKA